MAIDTGTPNSDGWWLQQAWNKLTDPRRVSRLERLDRYFRNDPPLPENMMRLQDYIRDFLNTSRTNFAELIVEAARERMQPIGIRTGADAHESGDQTAWALWRLCGCPVEAADVHQMMLEFGDGYVIVGYDDTLGRPVVTAEDPRQVVTFHDPRHQRQVIAAAKFFYDPQQGREYGYLYLPGRVRVAVHDVSVGMAPHKVVFTPSVWSWSDEVDTSPLGGPLPPALGDVVPVVRFRNRRGIGEFELHTDVLDRINRMVLRRLIVASFQAFRQRALQGDLPETDEQGREIDWNAVLEAGPDALWLLPADVKIWESGQVDLTPILSSVKDDVLFLAAVTRTPLSMLTPDAAAQSAEGASLQREGLVFKVEDRVARAADAHAQVVALMFRWMDDTTRSNVNSIELMWAPVERYSLSEMGSAWAQFVGLPFETKLRYILRMNPDEVARTKTELLDDQVQSALATIQAPPPPVAKPVA